VNKDEDDDDGGDGDDGDVFGDLEKTGGLKGNSRYARCRIFILVAPPISYESRETQNL
jgi:hypothetical protein